MKKILTILLLFLFFQKAYSQEVTISEPITFRTDDSFDVLGKIDGKYLVFQDQSTEFKVHALDSKLQQKWEKEIELEKRRTKVIGLVPTRNDFSIIYSFRKKGDLYLRAGRYDSEAELIDSGEIKVYDKLMVSPNFEVIRSEDKTKVLLYYIKEQKNIEAVVYDLETMKVIWEKSIRPKSMSYQEDFEQMLINNDGELFLVLEKDNRKGKIDIHHFEIHKTNSTGESSSFKVHMENHLTFNIHFSFDNKNNQLIAAGLYSEKNRGRSNGYFFTNIPNNNPTSYQNTFQAFDEEFIVNLLGKKADIKKGVPDIDVQEIVHRHDGGILLIAERNRKLQRGTSSNAPYYTRGSLSNMDYYFDDVFVISIHPNGETHWKNILHKRQYSQDDDAVFSSYFLLKTPSSLRFLFNDEIKQENTVSEYVLKANGSMDRKSLLNTENQKIQLQFAHAMQTASNEVIIPSSKRNRLKIIKLKY